MSGTPESPLVAEFVQLAQECLASGNVPMGARRLAELSVEIGRMRRDLSPPDWAVAERVFEHLKEHGSFVRHWHRERGEIPLPPHRPAAPARGLRELPRIPPKVLPFFRAATQLRAWDPPVEVLLPKPDDRDLALALLWTGADTSRDGGHLPMDLSLARAKKEYPKDWSLTTMLAARLGERAAGSFYRSIGCVVKDVAAGQLDSHESDWTLMDLVVDGTPIDVKNARRGRADPDRYVEHIVPRFKRSTAGEVTICGVLSDFRWVEQLIDGPPGSGRALILGETSQSKHTWLEKRYASPGVLDLDLTLGDGAAAFLPGWVFDLPEKLDDRRVELVGEIRNQIARVQVTWADEEVLPFALAARTLPTCDSGSPTKPWSIDFLRHLEEDLLTSRARLPIVFLSVLSDTLKVAAGSANRPGFSPADYRPLIFMGFGGTSWPSGVYDPLGMVDSLIQCLEQLWSRRSAFRSFRQFSLRRFNILRGRRSSKDAWWTVLAYCGGREDRGQGTRCGRNPLLLGTDVWCRTCRRLVCSSCGHCSDSCGSNYSSDRSQGTPVPT